jgi:hypothetical protein
VPDEFPLQLVTYPDGTKVYRRYGFDWTSIDFKLTSDAARLAIELEAFRIGGTDKLDGHENLSGKSKFQHFKGLCQLFWPNFEWHRWADWCGERICQHRICGFTGSASSAKSTIMVLYGLVSYISDPENTIVFVLTTTVKDAENRIWKEYTQRFNELKRGGLTGFKMVNREHYIGMVDGSRGSGKGTAIQLVAAGDKDRDNALQKLQGVKAGGKLILEVDESQDTSPDVYRAITNLANNAGFECKCAGNAANRLDPHGVFCTPVDGWASITAESKEWPIKLQGIPGVCVHLDGYDSPNFDDRDDVTWNDDGSPIFDRYNPSIKDRYPYIKRTDRVKVELEELGEKDGNFWRQCRGFWAPSDVESNVIYPTADLIRYGGMDKEVVWLMPPIEVMSWDPAKGGGDRFMGHHLKFGLCKINGKEREFPVIYDYQKYNLKIIGDTEDSSQQRNMVLECKKIAELLKIPPRNVAVDASSLDPIAGHFRDNWSRDILFVDFNGSPSNLPFNSTEVHESGPLKGKPKTSKDIFDRRVSELWWIGKEFLRHKQLAGIDIETAKEMSIRQYGTKGGKKFVEPKGDYKDRNKGISPDDADSLFVGYALLRERFGAIAGGGNMRLNPYVDVFGKKSVDVKQPYKIQQLKTQAQFSRPPDKPEDNRNELQRWMQKAGLR